MNKKLILITLLALPMVAFSQVYEKEKSTNELKVEARDFRKTFDAVRSKHSTSNNQYKLGMMYQAGYGVKANIKEAIKWYEIAAQNKNEYAMFTLGLIYERGFAEGEINYKEIDQLSLEKNGYRTTTAWWFEYAITGDLDFPRETNFRLFNYGILRENRFKSVKTDYKRAHKWYLSAIKQNKKFFGARYRLGTMHYYGLGVEKNNKIALNYFLEESKLGQNIVRKIKRTFTPKSYSTIGDTIIIDSIVGFNIATMYFHGYGVTQDYHEAEKWFKKSGKLSLGIPALVYVPALYQLGKMHYHGLGVKQSYKNALQYLKDAGSVPSPGIGPRFIIYEVNISKDGNLTIYGERRKAIVNSMVLLAHMYRNGLGVRRNEKNNKQAVGWNYFAALSGHTQSIAALNTLGYNVPFNNNQDLLDDYDDVFNINAFIPEDFSNPYVIDHEIIWGVKTISELAIDFNNEIENLPELEVINLLRQARAGDIQSQLKLAKYYSKATYNRSNKVAAYAWMTIAADSGSIEAIQMRNLYQNSLTDSQKLMAFEFARNVILTDDLEYREIYEVNENNRIAKEKQEVLAKLTVEKETAINVLEKEFEQKKTEDFSNPDVIDNETIWGVEAIPELAIDLNNDMLINNENENNTEQELIKIEGLYKKSLISNEERQLMRKKALGLN